MKRFIKLLLAVLPLGTAAQNVGIGTVAPEGALDVNSLHTTPQSAITNGALPFGADVADLVLTHRHGPLNAGFGYPGSLMDFRVTNGGDNFSTGQIMGVADPNGGSGWSGGLAFFTNPGGAADPAGRRNRGGAPVARMLIDHLGRTGVGTTLPRVRLHVDGDLMLGNDANGQRFLWHTREGAAGDFMQIVVDDAAGNPIWSEGILMARDGNVSIGGFYGPGAELVIRGDEAEASAAYEALLHLAVDNGVVGALYRNRNTASQNYLGIESFNVGNSQKTPLVLQEYGGNVGVGTSIPHQKMHIVGNSRTDGVAYAQAHIVEDYYVLENGNQTGPDGDYHRLVCLPGYALTGISIWSNDQLDGGEQIQCVKIAGMLQGTETWRSQNATPSAQGTSTGTQGVADATMHWAKCADDEVATGFEAYSDNKLDGRIKLRCTRLNSNWAVNTPWGYPALMTYPVIDADYQDERQHFSVCPAGAVVHRFEIYATTRLDRGLKVFCTGIRPN